MVGIKDVARQAGVSVGTVSNGINRPDLVSEQTRARVQAAIDLLGFVRSESARQLRAGRSRIVAMLVLDMANPFFVQVARGAEREARAAGLGVMLCNSAQDPSEEAEYLSLFAEQRVRGVLVAPADPTGANLAAFRRRAPPRGRPPAGQGPYRADLRERTDAPRAVPRPAHRSAGRLERPRAARGRAHAHRGAQARRGRRPRGGSAAARPLPPPDCRVLRERPALLRRTPGPLCRRNRRT